MKGNLMIRLMTVMILFGIGLAHFSGQTNLMSLNWLWLAILPALMGFQATFTGWCPAEMVGKLSKTGECCPNGSCSTRSKAESQTEAKSSCCHGQAELTGNTQNTGCHSTEEQLEHTASACCGGGMLEIKVLGTGCDTCTNTVKLIESTAQELGVMVKVTKVEEIADIAAFGVMSTPSIVINEQVVHSGCMPNKKMIIEWLS